MTEYELVLPVDTPSDTLNGGGQYGHLPVVYYSTKEQLQELISGGGGVGFGDKTSSPSELKRSKQQRSVSVLNSDQQVTRATDNRNKSTTNNNAVAAVKRKASRRESSVEQGERRRSSDLFSVFGTASVNFARCRGSTNGAVETRRVSGLEGHEGDPLGNGRGKLKHQQSQSPSSTSNWSNLVSYVETLRGKNRSDEVDAEKDGEDEEEEAEEKPEHREPPDCLPTGCYQ